MDFLGISIATWILILVITALVIWAVWYWMSAPACGVLPEMPTNETQTNNGNISIVLYYAAWCPASQNFLSEWERVKAIAAQRGITTVTIKCDDEPEIRKRAKISYYPTIRFRIGQNEIDHTGGRSAEEIISKAQELFAKMKVF